MKKYFFRPEIMDNFANDREVISRGRELRERGYKLHHHPIWGNSIEIPSGEQLSKTQMKVRYSNSDNKKIIEKAFEYLVLCEEVLCKISGLEFKL